MIQCLAPLPEDLDNPVLEKMPEPAPCLVPLKEDEGGIKRAKDNPVSCLASIATYSNRGNERLREGG